MILRNKLHAFVDPAKKLLVLDTQSNEAKELQQLTLQYVDKMKAMVENNERLVDIMSGGQVYGYKERSNAEIMMINASKRNKTLVKGGTSMVPSIGTTSNQMLREGPVGVQVATNKAWVNYFAWLYNPYLSN